MHDVIIIGGSYAGLSAALQLARARKKVLVIDSGRRRNRFASHAHGFVSQDGRPPADIALDGRRQLMAYPNVDWLEEEAVGASGAIDGFAIETRGGGIRHARRLVLAGGVEDVLPDIKGLADLWGEHAFGCPYCHGYELSGGSLAVIATGAPSLHHATVVAEWGPTTLFINRALEPAEAEIEDLHRRGLSIEATPIEAVELSSEMPTIRLADGRSLPFAGIFVTTGVRLVGDIARQLGCRLDTTPIGDLIHVDGQQATSVPGVFAAGDCTSPMASIALAVGRGAMAGAATHRSLMFAPAGASKAA